MNYRKWWRRIHIDPQGIEDIRDSLQIRMAIGYALVEFFTKLKALPLPAHIKSP